MKLKQYIAFAALTMPLAASAQSVIDFETDATKGASVSVFDTWENSPFRTNKLNGNIKVIDNPFKVVDEITGNGNKSNKVLAFQRSRFGSSTFGARVELSAPLALTQKTKYVHVKIYTPKADKIMLFALGKRTDRADQSKDVVQVEANCISSVKANKWCDAVFAISSAPGVNIHSFLIIPDLQSTHDLDQDFAVYVDDIEVNNTSMPSIQYGVYPTSYDKTATKENNGRYTSGVNFKSSDGQQSLSTNQQSNKLVFQDLLASSLKAKAGDEITTSVNYQGGWMNAYVYLDRDNNGKFDYTLNEQGTPAEKSDVMSFSNYNNKNSKGEAKIGNDRNTTSLPNFTIPSDLKPGFYRLRYKVDWDCIDPAGNTSDGNTITHNSGAIIDTRLNVHGEKVNIWRGEHTEGTNGEMLTTDGKNFEKHEIAFGKDYTVKFKPGDGFKVGKIFLRHGYNLEKDSLVNETPQYTDVILPAYMAKDNTLTIPAEYIDGDVRITPTFVSIKGESTEKYALNFEKDLLIDRAPGQERSLNSLSFNTTTHPNAQKILPTNKKLVYQDFTNRSIYVKRGDVITTNIDYTPNKNAYMHPYLYVDLDGDGVFNTAVNADGTPAFDGEMLSYAFYNNKNSNGAAAGENPSSCFDKTNSMPQFKIPAGLPTGKYRARFKLDWSDPDPAGRYNKGGNDIHKNGGYVVDFNFNVVDEYPTVKLDVQTTNGSIVGADNTGMPETHLLGSPISVMAFGAADNYNATEIVVRHGKNLDGEAVVDGKTQWKEESVELTNGACTIPAEMVDGDVRLSATFEDAGAEYKLAFGDEFNTADFTQPNETHWSRSGWAHPTWKRFTAQTKAGQEKTGWIEDGKLVLRCVKNEFNDEKRGDNGSKLEMISGAIESANKVTFTYGKVEGRLKTTAHSGNFPAFWMMPNESTYGGWPSSGEIDIFEQINNENTSYHTIHSHWANGAADGGLGNSGKPQKSGTSATTTGEYHVYGLEWTEDILKWFVDGKQVFSYAKSTTQDDLDKLQWPFDKPFYLILNQSVGNGGWASNPDLNFTYETKFDWVRVYQKANGDLTGINNASATSSFDFYVSAGKVRLVAAKQTLATIYDLSGRKVFSQTIQGNVDVRLPQGIYVINGQKVVIP